MINRLLLLLQVIGYSAIIFVMTIPICLTLPIWIAVWVFFGEDTKLLYPIHKLHEVIDLLVDKTI